MSQNRAKILNDTRDTHDTLVCQPIQHKTTCEVCRKNQKTQKIFAQTFVDRNVDIVNLQRRTKEKTCSP